MDRTTRPAPRRPRAWAAVAAASVLATASASARQAAPEAPPARRPSPAANDPRARAAAMAAARPFVVDVRDFGAKGDGVADDGPAIQLAVDTLAARMDRIVSPGAPVVGTVLIPATPKAYKTRSTVWVDHDHIEIRGEGPGSQVRTEAGMNHPLFLFGLRRESKTTFEKKEYAAVADARYRPDLFGRLDASAVPGPGQRWGFRTRGEALILAIATPLSDGPKHSTGTASDHWTECPALTMEFAYQAPGDHLANKTVLFGLNSVHPDEPAPFFLYVGDDPGRVYLRFATQSEPLGARTTRAASFLVPPGRGARRVSVQIDLRAAKVAAYVDGLQVAVDGHRLGADFRPGLRLAENDLFPLLVGGGGGDTPTLGRLNEPDWALYGLLLSRTARYRDGAPGTPQRRADGDSGRIDDRYRYFTPEADDPGQIGHLTFADDPAARGRALSIQGGPASGNARSVAFILHQLGGNNGGIGHNAVRDLNLVGGGPYGQNLAIGAVLDMSITGVTSADAYHAIGSFPLGANYVVRLEDCRLKGNDSGYYGAYQILWARNISFIIAGRVTMRFAGSVVKMQNMMVSFHTPGHQSTIKIHASEYGGNYTFDHLNVDFEGYTYEHTPIYCEVHPYMPMTTLRLTDVLLGTVGEDKPLITLREHPLGSGKAYLSVDNIITYSKRAAAVVDVDGPMWTGEVRGIAAGAGTPMLRYRGKPGTASRIIFRD